MTEVISIKFRSCGKQYFFAPGNLTVSQGDKVIVETAKGLEIADCSRGNHMVEDTAVVQPLREVIRIATEQDIRTSEQLRAKEEEALKICKKKVAEHGLDMKLVSAECNFEGNKTMFFFTSEGRVDFRELVKDLAGIFHNRIELRQIGVRDEAKMIGGIAICGRPYCCGQFLDDFAPVSTKMAKVQSLSLNPAKISGSCGRLMCCLRYEEDAYEDLVKRVPKQGSFVQTEQGYGTVVQTNLLRQYVKVRLDGAGEDELQQFPADEVAAVPGGRPQEGEPYPDLLKDRPKKEKEEILPDEGDPWASPSLFATDAAEVAERRNRSASAGTAPEEQDEAGERAGVRNGTRKKSGQSYTEQPRRPEKAGVKNEASDKKNDKTAKNDRKPGKDRTENEKAEQNRQSVENRKPGAFAQKKKQPLKNAPAKAQQNNGRKAESDTDEAGQLGEQFKSRNRNAEPAANREKKSPHRKEHPGSGVQPKEKRNAAEPADRIPAGTVPESAGEQAAGSAEEPAKKRFYGNRHRYYGKHTRSPEKPGGGTPPSGGNS